MGNSATFAAITGAAVASAVHFEARPPQWAALAAAAQAIAVAETRCRWWRRGAAHEGIWRCRGLGHGEQQHQHGAARHHRQACVAG